MAWRSLMRAAAGLVVASVMLGLAAGCSRADDPSALLARMAKRPLRYGGEICCGRPGRILVALDWPATDGSIHGDAMLLTPDRHLIGAGTVTGSWQAPFVPGGHDCTLQLLLQTRKLTLNGVCSPSILTGAIHDGRATPRGWFGRQLFREDDADSAGRSWLIRSDFRD